MGRGTPGVAGAPDKAVPGTAGAPGTGEAGRGAGAGFAPPTVTPKSFIEEDQDYRSGGEAQV